MIPLESIFDLFDQEQFRRIPQIYLGVKSITRLNIYMEGYQMCESINKIHSRTNPPFELFYLWIVRKYNEIGTSDHWVQIILKKCYNDEELALEEFFKRFDEFRTYKPIKIFSTTPHENSPKLFSFRGKEDSLLTENKTTSFEYRATEKIFIIEYDGNFGSTVHEYLSSQKYSSKYFSTTKEAILNVQTEYNQSLEWEEEDALHLNKLYDVLN